MNTRETTTAEVKQTSEGHPVLARIGWVLLFIAIRIMVRAMFSH